ncbi:phosphatidylserine/phosphatidylglycerophosphate/cardiolipin synthase family protein [bacterium]|nr:phosphatidylserine/phosphatidylglycerophosphate/cardiolipin synthase family protein [bacterium]
MPALGQLADRLAWDPGLLTLGDRLGAAAAPDRPGELALCVDGPQFMAALSRDLAGARREVVVQTLAFEADPAGLALARALLDSPAPRRRLLIDDYSRHVQSDKVVGAPNRLLDAALAREAEQTRALITQLRAHGVEVKYGRPLTSPADLLRPRDHKKLAIVDGRVAYLGGINFSAHNFLWHDLMLRVAHPEAARFLAADFERSWAGRSVPVQGRFPGLDLVCAAGGGDEAVAATIGAEIDRAARRIVLECPYVTEPYLTRLAAARARGVQVTILTSERSNRLGMKQGIMDACRRNGIDLRLLPGPMTHVKALLVDDATLVVGSANFDFLSARLQPELVAVVQDRDLVGDFRERVLGPDLARSRPWRPDETSPVATALGAGLINLARDVTGALTGAAR